MYSSSPVLFSFPPSSFEEEIGKKRKKRPLSSPFIWILWDLYLINRNERKLDDGDFENVQVYPSGLVVIPKSPNKEIGVNPIYEVNMDHPVKYPNTFRGQIETFSSRLIWSASYIVPLGSVFWGARTVYCLDRSPTSEQGSGHCSYKSSDVNSLRTLMVFSEEITPESVRRFSFGKLMYYYTPLGRLGFKQEGAGRCRQKLSESGN